MTPGAPRHFAWQAWHLVTSTLISRGRRGTNSHLPSFCVAGVALMVLGGALGPGFVACDARGAAPLCVAGVALGDIHLDITWQAWHKLTSTVVNLTSTFVLHGRRGTISHPPSFCVAGVALMGLGGALGPVWSRMTPRHFAWQVWHNLTSTFVLHGRRGTISHPPSFCVAGVALMGLGGALGLVWSRMTPRHFAWQAWHNLTSTFVLHGRRGAISHPPSFCVAGVTLMGLGGALGPVWLRMTPRHFAWQAWHNLTSTFVLHGRRGAISHPPSFCVAGVALMGLGGALGPVWSRMTPRHFAWQAWHNLTSTFVFAWQAWHNLTSTFVLRGRRGTHGTGWRAWAGLVADDAAALCVAGVAQPHIHLRFAWQAWRNLTSTFVLRGRRGTHGTGWRTWAGLVADDAAALCVAGVAQPHIHLRFAWQAWHHLTSTFVLHGRRSTW